MGFNPDPTITQRSANNWDTFNNMHPEGEKITLDTNVYVDDTKTLWVVIHKGKDHSNWSTNDAPLVHFQQVTTEGVFVSNFISRAKVFTMVRTAREWSQPLMTMK